MYIGSFTNNTFFGMKLYFFFFSYFVAAYTVPVVVVNVEENLLCRLLRDEFNLFGFSIRRGLFNLHRTLYHDITYTTWDGWAGSVFFMRD